MLTEFGQGFNVGSPLNQFCATSNVMRGGAAPDVMLRTGTNTILWICAAYCAASMIRCLTAVLLAWAVLVSVLLWLD
jgi:hypothetical protein